MALSLMPFTPPDEEIELKLPLKDTGSQVERRAAAADDQIRRGERAEGRATNAFGG